MKINSIFTYVLTVLLFAFFLAACGDKKEDEPGSTPETPEGEVVDTTEGNEAEAIEDTTMVPEVPEAPNMVGTWTGKLDGRATTLVITEQTDTEISGKITVNYRHPVNQTISGSVNPEDLTFTMRDLEQARSAGTYSGSLSEDGLTMTGTFKLNRDGSTYPFSLSLNQ